MEALATLGRDAMVAGGGEEYEVSLPFLQNFKENFWLLKIFADYIIHYI